MNTKTKTQVVAPAPVEPVIAEVLTQEQISTLSEAGKMFSNADLDKSTAVMNVSAVMVSFGSNFAHSHFKRIEEVVGSSIASNQPELSEKMVTQKQSRLMGDALKLAELEKPKSQSVDAKKKNATREARAKKVEKLSKLDLSEISERIAKANQKLINALSKADRKLAMAELDLITDARDLNIAPEINAKREEIKARVSFVRAWLTDKLSSDKVNKGKISLADTRKLEEMHALIKE